MIRVSGRRSARHFSLAAVFATVAAALLSVVAAALGFAGVPVTVGGYTARVTNPSDTIASGSYFTCTSAAVGDAATNAYLAYPLNDAGPSTAADVSGNNRPGTYSLTGITYHAAGPCPRDGAKAVTLNGLTGYITGAATPTNPQIFSLEIWFKTTIGGGKLIGLGSSPIGLSAQYDRHLFLSNTGTLTFGVYPNNTVKTITSPASYLDGAWHDAIATLAPSTDPNPGMRLYVDGALVAVDATTTSAQNASGYWRIGYDNLAAWGPNTPLDFFFTGSLAYASTYQYAMTPAQVAAHYRAGT